MRLDAITLRQLRALLAVDEAGSMTGAAHLLSLSAPAIHAQIKGLEDAYGCRLVRRAADNTGSELTSEGKAVLEAAVRLEGILSQSGEQVRAIAKGMVGRVTLGVVSTGKYFAPRLVKMLKERCPEIEVALRVGNRETVISGLDRGHLDLAVMGRPPRHPVVEAEVLGPHPHGLLADPTHRLAGQKTVSADDLAAEVILSREEGSGTRILMTRYLDRIGEGRVFDLYEMDSNETIKQAAMAGLGIAFLSLHTATEELATGRLHFIRAPGLPIDRQWFLVRPTAFAAKSVTARLHDAILSLDGAYLPSPAAQTGTS